MNIIVPSEQSSGYNRDIKVKQFLHIIEETFQPMLDHANLPYQLPDGNIAAIWATRFCVALMTISCTDPFNNFFFLLYHIFQAWHQVLQLFDTHRFPHS